MVTIQNQRPLPPGWRRVRLGEVCERIDYGFTASADYSVAEPHFLRITDIQRGTVDWCTVPGCKIGATEERANALANSDIVFARTGATTGKSFLITNPPRSVFASYLIRLRTKPDALPDFVYAFFQSDAYWSQIRANQRGGAQPNVNATILGSLSLPLPPLDEQTRISAILNKQMAAVERARAAAEARLEAAKALPAAYLRAVFSGPDAQKWPKRPLVQVGEIVSGITLGRKLNGAKTRLVPYLRVANVKDAYLDLSNVYKIEATEAEIEKCKLRDGDLLLTEGGDPDKLGRGTFWEGQIAECIHQNHIFRVRFGLTEISPQFISAQLASVYGKRYFLAHAKQTTGIATINQKVLGSFPLLLPPLADQRRVTSMLNEQVASATLARKAIDEELDAINKLPAALLRRAFTGGL